MAVSPELQTKLAKLPKDPGVYFHKDSSGEIIYVGKAARLNNRVRQYFQNSRLRDPKTDALVAEIADTDWMVVGSELEALFLEAEMIRRYMPRYNILLRDDKSMVYIRIDYDSDYPTVSTTRRPLDDGARYFGPYLSAVSVRAALKLLRRVFPYATRRMAGQKRASLHYHIGLDPGLEEGKTSLIEYRANLRQLMRVIQGKRHDVENELEQAMDVFAKQSQFERAAIVRNQLFALRRLSQQVVFSDKEFMDISKDHALVELTELLSLPKIPARIEGYDISHMSGRDVVASMVVFTNGVSNKGEYRKFKTRKDQNNDFDNMRETIARRLSAKNIKQWGKPDLILIDGGKGQLDAALQARDTQGQSALPFIGLAKREEQIVVARNRSRVSINAKVLQKLAGYTEESNDFVLINLPHHANAVKLLQRIRDESHRFAVSYHSTLKRSRQTSSVLDDVPGIGPATKKKLIRTFGSTRAVLQATDSELTKVVGPAIVTHIAALRRGSSGIVDVYD
ncbi:excinuclease ABC subunit UvrC [Candidatus Saccharibacteria bacterium]|nr:excinuclease ABC subunit UvrC [Candidatus Saccharibacteria bacterium]